MTENTGTTPPFLRIDFMAPGDFDQATVIAQRPAVLVGDGTRPWRAMTLKPSALELLLLLALAPEGLCAQDLGHALAVRPEGGSAPDGGRGARDTARKALQVALADVGASERLHVPARQGRTDEVYSLEIHSTDLSELRSAVKREDLATAAALSHSGTGWIRGITVSGGVERLPHHQPWVHRAGRLKEAPDGSATDLGALPRTVLEQAVRDAQWVRGRLLHTTNGQTSAEGAQPTETSEVSSALDTGVSVQEPGAQPVPGEDVRPPVHQGPNPNESREGTDGDRRHIGRRGGAALVLVVAVIVIIGIAVFVTQNGERSSPADAVTARAASLEPTYRVRAGGPARTWSDFTIAGGTRGPQIIKSSLIKVTCRTDGYVVDDGNRWWYLIASSPWNKRFWATADTFYNKPGLTSGPLKRTPFFDARIPVCP